MLNCLLASEALDPLVVGVDLCAAFASDVGGCHGGDEEKDLKQAGACAFDAGKEASSEGEVQCRGENEGSGDDHYSVQDMPGARFVACGHSAEIEREGGGEDEQE